MLINNVEPSTAPFILHFSSINTWGGGEQQLCYLYEGLAKQGFSQLLVCRTGSALAAYGKDHRFQLINYCKMGSVDLKAAFKLAVLCKQHAVTILHVHDAHAHTTALLAKMLFRISPTLIISRKVTFPLKQTRFTRYKYQSPHIKRIICISKAVKDVIDTSVLQPNKTIVIHDGIDITRFKSAPLFSLRQQLGVSDNTILVGIAASLTKAKDLYTFINVAKQLKSPTIKWLIMGDGPLREALVVYVRNEGLTNDVIFMGFRTDLPQILPQLNCFMLTSEEEGLGSVLLEAMASRVPVVATRTGGIPEAIIEEKTGLLADVKDVMTLTAQVSRVLTNPTLCEQLSSSAYASLDQYSVESMVEKTIAVYME